MLSSGQLITALYILYTSLPCIIPFGMAASKNANRVVAAFMPILVIGLFAYACYVVIAQATSATLLPSHKVWSER